MDTRGYLCACVSKSATDAVQLGRCRSCARAHKHTFEHTHTLEHTHTHTRGTAACARTHIHTFEHTHLNTHTHLNIHTHTRGTMYVCRGAKESRRGEEDESRMPIKHGGTGGHSHVLLRMAEEYNTCVWYIPCAYCVWNIPCVCARTHRLRTRSAKEAWVYSTSLATQRTSFRSTTCSRVVSVTASPSLRMTRPDTMLAASTSRA